MLLTMLGCGSAGDKQDDMEDDGVSGEKQQLMLPGAASSFAHPSIATESLISALAMPTFDPNGAIIYPLVDLMHDLLRQPPFPQQSRVLKSILSVMSSQSQSTNPNDNQSANIPSPPYPPVSIILSTPNKDGYTPLDLAVMRGLVDMVPALIEAGADVRGGGRERDNILLCALQSPFTRYVLCVIMLLYDRACCL